MGIWAQISILQLLLKRKSLSSWRQLSQTLNAEKEDWLVDYEWHPAGEQEVNAQKLELPNGIQVTDYTGQKSQDTVGQRFRVVLGADKKSFLQILRTALRSALESLCLVLQKRSEGVLFHLRAQELEHNLGQDITFSLTYFVTLSQDLAIVSGCLGRVVTCKGKG